MVVKRRKEQGTKSADNTQGIRKEFDRLDQSKINIASTKLTLSLNEMKKSVEILEHVRTTSVSLYIRVFGKEGVGGITSEKVCVQVDGDRADVWIDKDLRAVLLRKDELNKPDELMEIPGFRVYAPIFKALSNCGISINHVAATANM